LLSAFDDELLWVSLSEFLTDPVVGNADKDIAFDRLAYERPPMPDSARQVFTRDSDRILRAKNLDLFGDAAVPYSPAGVRFACAYDLAPSRIVVRAISELAGSRSAAARAEGAACLPFAARVASNQWSQGLLLQMSYDFDPTVRAEAARSMSSFIEDDDSLAALVRDRLRELLTSDGLLIPLRALQGIRDSEAHYRRIDEDLAVLAASPSRTIRRIANEILEASLDSKKP
jgi:hypothetical protein